jgi:hypothetical protein
MTVTAMNLGRVVEEATAAEQEALEAQARAEAARRKAQEAKQAADRERKAANRDYWQLLEAEYPEQRRHSLEAAAAAGETFRQVARGEVAGDLVGSWRTWAESRAEVWRVDARLGRARETNGQASRLTIDPAPASFLHDLTGVLDRLANDLLDAATERNRTERQQFLNGATR